MKILGILGSPHHRGNTSILLDAVLAGAQAAGAETEQVDLSFEDIHFCAGCSQCYRTGRCQYDDEIEAVKAQMLKADGLVLGSPVYITSVTAQMKTLLDRSALFVHCFTLTGKYGAAVATAGGEDPEPTAEYLNRFLRNCGASTVGSVGALAALPHGVRDEATVVARAAALGRDLVTAIATCRAYPDQEAARQPLFERMHALVSRGGEKYPYQWAQWQSRGWL